MPSIAEQMKGASLITQQMVRQAMQEAQTDPTCLTHLEHVIDQSGVEQKFEDKAQLDLLIQFVLEYNVDKFQVAPNTQNALPRQPIITEARITKTQNQKRQVNHDPPPVPRGAYRDPLNLTGTAERGAKIEFYNASRPGRPALGETTVRQDGTWTFQLDQEELFKFGDQIGVRVVDAHGDKSKPVIVPTKPFMVTNTEIEHIRGGQVIGRDFDVRHQALDPHQDDVDPFYQKQKVKTTIEAPGELGQPWTMELRGGDDACEPNAKVEVVVNGETFHTTADDEGKFALKIRGFTPGEVLNVKVTDINNRGFNFPMETRPIDLNMSKIAGGVFTAPTAQQPTNADQVVGTTGNWIAWKASEVCPPNGAVVVRNMTTGDVFELKANDKGSINAAVGGINERDVLEIAVRDVNGIFSPNTERAVVLSEKLQGAKGYLVPVHDLDRQTCDNVATVVQSIKGPPVDLLRNGKADPRGPFLRMPDTAGFPPFGQLAVVRDGEVIQTLKADAQGRLKGMLMGVHVGDQLNFRVLDAAGRQFPGELTGWTVPDAGKTSKVGGTHISSADRSLSECIEEIGKGTLDLPHEWVAPFRVTAQGGGPINPNVKLHYPRETFGNRDVEKTAEQAIGGISQPLHEMFKVPPPAQGYTSQHGHVLQGHTLELKEQNGTKRIEIGTLVQINNRQHGNQPYTQPVATAAVGIDFVMGTVNAGDPNTPIQIPQGLAPLTNVLRQTLAMTAAAYDQGKEHGDVAYARGMSTAKAILYVFDKLASNPANAAHKDAIVAAAKAAFPAGGFPFELPDPSRVPLSSQDASAKVTGQKTSTMSLIDARAAAVGRTELPTQTQGVQPPRIESAIVLRQQQGQQQHEPLRVKGRAQPGDVIQIYNWSTAGRQLLAETIAGPDGRFEIVAAPTDIRYGDKLGVLSIRGDQQSRTALVPTDGYSYDGRDLKTAVPVTTDERQPFIQQGRMAILNRSFDENGKVHAGGPRWELTGDSLAVEPLSWITVRSKTAEGRAFEQKVQADDEGRFSLEFPSLSHANFDVTISDGRSEPMKARMQTPGLTETKKVTGDIAADMANGSIIFHLPGGEVKGTIVEHSYRGNRQNPTKLERIPDADRNDAFVDVLVNIPYKQVYPGQVREYNIEARIKIPKEHAAKFGAQVNEKLAITCPALATLPIDPSNDGSQPQHQLLEIRQEGPVTVVDRDYLLDN